MAKIPMGNSRLLLPLLMAIAKRDPFLLWCPYQLLKLDSDSSCWDLLLTYVPVAVPMKINILTGQSELQTFPCLTESMARQWTAHAKYGGEAGEARRQCWQKKAWRQVLISMIPHSTLQWWSCPALKGAHKLTSKIRTRDESVGVLSLGQPWVSKVPGTGIFFTGFVSYVILHEVRILYFLFIFTITP